VLKLTKEFFTTFFFFPNGKIHSTLKFWNFQAPHLCKKTRTLMERPWVFRNSVPSYTARLEERIYGESLFYA
jgi:hypothetical protein